MTTVHTAQYLSLSPRFVIYIKSEEEQVMDIDDTRGAIIDKVVLRSYSDVLESILDIYDCKVSNELSQRTEL